MRIHEIEQSSRRWVGFGPGTSRYMRGQCFDFALALLAKMKGGRLVEIGGYEHVAVERGGLYYDVRGALTEGDFRRGVRGGDTEIDPADLDTVLLHAGLAGQTPPYRSPEMNAARKVVSQYVKDMGL